MKRTSLILLLLVCIAAAWACVRVLYDPNDSTSPPPATSPPTDGQSFQVLRVVDGDTIRIDYHGKKAYVRFLHINTPEKGRRGCEEATRALEQLISGRKVILQFEVPGVVATDRYGRLLAYVLVDGKNLNLEMVQLGWSRFWPVFGEGQMADEFRAAQQVAKLAKRGIWTWVKPRENK